MSEKFVEHMVKAWESYDAQRKEREFQVGDRVFRQRLEVAAEQMFGVIARQLEWTVEDRFGKPCGRAELGETGVALDWAPDLTGIYVFTAWSLDYDDRVVKHSIDGRLKLAAILYEAGANS